ncbi:hypothetical protein YUBABA_00940 [Serratia phage vB_SmaM-Yubaba]|nr:hypothetical protein SUREIYA_01420 [Serratia phage vB_SmaM-Sureiya]UQT03300.1 hypothetical protein YUBABA_00940 [Serratia phage vB_SmaM-Yubaba]
MKQTKGVSRRDLLAFFFGSAISPKAKVEDAVLDLVLGKEANLLINFRKRFCNGK